MTDSETKQIKRLFKLVDLSEEFGDILSLQLVNHWCELREQHGLAQTLRLIQEHARTYTTETYPPQTQHANQDATPVQ